MTHGTTHKVIPKCLSLSLQRRLKLNHILGRFIFLELALELGHFDNESMMAI